MAARIESRTRVHTAHTADLDIPTLRAARALLEDVFGAELTDADWKHCLGGIHALVWEGDELIGHAAVVQRRLLHADRTLRAGYVEGIGVRADRRRRGHGSAMMAALERIVRGGYDLGALGATDEAMSFYRNRTWRRWEGPTFALTAKGVIRTPDEDDCVFVLPGIVPLDVTGELICDWREGDLW